MSLDQITAALDRIGDTQAEQAVVLGVGDRTVNGWANGRPVPEPARRLLLLLAAHPDLIPEALELGDHASPASSGCTSSEAARPV